MSSVNDRNIQPPETAASSAAQPVTEKTTKEQEEKVESKNEEKDILSKPGKFGANRTKNSRFVDLISSDEESPISRFLSTAPGEVKGALNTNHQVGDGVLDEGLDPPCKPVPTVAHGRFPVG